MLLYELLTGSTPFDSGELLRKGYAEMVRVIREEEPHKPSTRLSTLGATATRTAELRRVDAKKLGSILRGDLDWIIMKALEKDRVRRYETATAFADDIGRHLGDEPVLASPPSAGYKMRKFVRRNKGLAVASSLVSAVLLVGIMGTSLGLWRAQLANSAKDVALSSELEAKDDAEWNSYTANLALAQTAMDNGNWPEARKRIAACPQNKRGWEWEYLSKRANSCIKEFPGEMTISPDGQHMVSYEKWRFTSKVNTLDLDGNLIGDPIVQENMVQDVQISSDNSHILVVTRGLGESTAVGSLFLIAYVYDIEGKLIGAPIQHENLMNRAHFSQDGQSIVTVSKDLSVRQWNLQGAVVAQLHDQQYRDDTQLNTLSNRDPYKTVFSPDGSQVLRVYEDQTVRILNLDGSKASKPLDQDGVVKIQLFSPDGLYVLTATENGSVQLWDLDGNQSGATIHTNGKPVSIVISPDGQRLLIEESDHSICMWDTEENRVGPVLRQEGKRKGLIAFSHDGGLVLISSSNNYSMRLWSRDGISLTGPLMAGNRGVLRSPVISQHGDRVLYSTFGRTCIWDIEGNLLGPCIRAPITSEFSDGHAVFLGDGKVLKKQINDVQKVSYLLIDPLHSTDTLREEFWYENISLIRDAEIDPYGVRDLPEEIAIQDKSFATGANLIAPHPDGFRIATVSSSNVIYIWEPENERLLAAIPMQYDVVDLGFTSDGTRLVIELDDYSTRIFDTRSAEEQSADVQRRWAERVPAGAYLDTLMAGPTPTDDLMGVIETAPSLTPIRRLAAAELLIERLRDIDNQANRAFDAITKDQTDQAVVLAVAHAADLPTRVKEKALAKAWEYQPPRDSAAEQLAEAEKTIELTKAQLEDKVEELKSAKDAARSKLGESLAKQAKFIDAQPLLIESADALQANGKASESRKNEAIQRVVDLYEAWHTAEPGKGYDAKAAQWRTKLSNSHPAE